MGRGKAKNEDERKRRRERAEQWQNTRATDGQADPARGWSSIVMENARFEAFYKAQNFIGEDEWPAFMDCVRTSLPATFRVNEDYAFADALREQMLEFVGQRLTVGGAEITAARQLRWYPCAYQLGVDRKQIRKEPEMARFHAWLVQHTDCGNITRQEAGACAVCRVPCAMCRVPCAV